MSEFAQEVEKVYPEISIIREGPQNKTIKDTLVASLTLHGETRFIKAFQEHGRETGRKELSEIQSFNTFASEAGISRKGPTIIEVREQPFFGFAMEDAGTKIEFPELTHEEAIALYDSYRTTRDAYGARRKDLPAKPEIKDFAQHQGKRLEKWIDSALPVVHEWVKFSKEELLTKLSELQKNVSIELDYSFGRFWGGHVFEKEGVRTLLDFDNVNYQIKGSELLGVMWSNTLLPVSRFGSYEERKASVDKRQEYALGQFEDQGLWKLLFFEKIVGTAFADL